MTEIYTIYKIDEIDYYKCINCDFYTKYLWSINRHSKNNNCINDIIYCEYCKKEFKYESEKEKHLNRKKKCYIECETLIEKQINKKNEKNINELKDENEKLLNDNKLLKNQIINDEKRIKLLETQKIENKIFMFNQYSNLLLDKERQKNEKNNMFIYDLEYHLLYNAITQYRDETDDASKLKEKLYLMMSFMKPERYNEFFNAVKKDYNYLIPYIIDYYNYLKTIDDKKINGKNRDSFLSDLGIKIKVYLEIDP